MKLDDSGKQDFFIDPPRTGILKAYFDDLILARKNIPKRYNFDIDEIFKQYPNLFELAKVYQKYESDFDKHARASIPFIYEEYIRLYGSIFEYLIGVKSGGSVIEIDAASGSTARAVTEMSQGKIKTMCVTPNKNNINIFKNNHPEGSYIFKGASKDAVSFLKNDKLSYDVFPDGFDIFLEPVGFQMYGKERSKPIKYFKQLIKKDGIMIFFEKNSHEDVKEYKKREKQKNEDFKKKFFNDSDIKEKTKEVLSIMDKNLVTLEELISAINHNFSYVVHTWNSGNFNILIASDSKKSIKNFLKTMVNIIIDEDYLYYDVPRVIKGDDLI